MLSLQAEENLKAIRQALDVLVKGISIYHERLKAEKDAVEALKALENSFSGIPPVREAGPDFDRMWISLPYFCSYKAPHLKATYGKFGLGLTKDRDSGKFMIYAWDLDNGEPIRICDLIPFDDEDTFFECLGDTPTEALYLAVESLQEWGYLNTGATAPDEPDIDDTLMEVPLRSFDDPKNPTKP